MKRIRSPFALALILGVAGLAAAIVAFVFVDALADLRSPLPQLGPVVSPSPLAGPSPRAGLVPGPLTGGPEGGPGAVLAAIPPVRLQPSLAAWSGASMRSSR